MLKTITPCSAVIAGLVFAAAATTAHAAPFDVYRGACLDTGVDLAKIRALAAAQKWDKLSETERDRLAPGSTTLEGWAIPKDNARYLVTISASTASAMAGDLSGAAIVSCSVLSPIGNEAPTLKTYADFLKRPATTKETIDGTTTYTWSIHSASNLTLHYLVAGPAMPGLSLSVNTIRK
jgi:hypothetical protein